MTYKIEVCTPKTQEWVIIELVETSIHEIVRRVQKIKKIYPEYLVRAFDMLGGRTIVVV